MADIVFGWELTGLAVAGAASAIGQERQRAAQRAAVQRAASLAAQDYFTAAIPWGNAEPPHRPLTRRLIQGKCVIKAIDGVPYEP